MTKRRGCPHEQMHFCPLYFASHRGDGLGCAGGDVGGCAVSHGRMSYQEGVRRLMAADPGFIEQCRFVAEKLGEAPYGLRGRA